MKRRRSASAVRAGGEGQADAGDEVAARRHPQDRAVDAADRLEVGGHGRGPGGQVLVELQRAHRLGQRGAAVREEAGVGGVREGGDPLARDGAVEDDVRLRQQRPEVRAVGQGPDEDDRALGPGSRQLPQRPDVEAVVEGADVEEPRSPQLREPARRRARLDPETRVDAVRHHRRGTLRVDPLDERIADRADPAAALGDGAVGVQQALAPGLVVAMGGEVVAGVQGHRPGPLELGEAGEERLRGDHRRALEAGPLRHSPQPPVVALIRPSQRRGAGRVLAAQAQGLPEAGAVACLEARRALDQVPRPLDRGAAGAVADEQPLDRRLAQHRQHQLVLREAHPAPLGGGPGHVVEGVDRVLRAHPLE